MRPSGLRVEHGPRLLGITETEPRLSWLLPAGATRQEAYRIDVGDWDSTRVSGDRSTYVRYAGPALRSRQEVIWRVKVWTDLGESDWSDPSSWEMGLLQSADWRARFVSPVEPERAPAAQRPAYVLRRTFELSGPVARGRAYATALGVYELFLNGTRVGDLELTPGFTAYRSHVEVQTYDIGPLLRAGTNTIEAVLSDGWYRGQVGFTREHDSYGSKVGLLLQLEVDLADGSELVIGTNEEWAAAPSGIVADLIEGQRENHRVRPVRWSAVEVVDHDLGRLTSSPAPPTRRIEELEPVAITDVGGSTVVDFGQNSNGWVRLQGLGPEGTRVRLTHGERLRPDGTVDMEHLRPFDFASREQLSAGQVDEVVASGLDGEVFEPRQTTHGFQFAEIEGHPDVIAPEDVRSVVVHTDLRRTGWFSCSDERINKLHDAAVWSFRGNACEVPTDCPQRERAGWTGDWQIFAPTAAFLYDVAGFSARWLRDLAADQWPDGRVPNFVPDPPGPKAHEHPIARYLTGSSGWGDAAVLVPWEMWVAYGDERFLERGYRAASRWVEFAARGSGRPPHDPDGPRAPSSRDLPLGQWFPLGGVV